MKAKIKTESEAQKLAGHCKCGTPLPPVGDDETPPQFCSPKCKGAGMKGMTKAEKIEILMDEEKDVGLAKHNKRATASHRRRLKLKRMHPMTPYEQQTSLVDELRMDIHDMYRKGQGWSEKCCRLEGKYEIEVGKWKAMLDG